MSSISHRQNGWYSPRPRLYSHGIMPCFTDESSIIHTHFSLLFLTITVILYQLISHVTRRILFSMSETRTFIIDSRILFSIWQPCPSITCSPYRMIYVHNKSSRWVFLLFTSLISSADSKEKHQSPTDWSSLISSFSLPRLSFSSYILYIIFSTFLILLIENNSNGYWKIIIRREKEEDDL